MIVSWGPFHDVVKVNCEKVPTTELNTAMETLLLVLSRLLSGECVGDHFIMLLG